MSDDLIGKRIGGYEIRDVIGRGGMATVYRAHQLSMNRTVALKVLPRHFVDNETYLQRFHREVKIVSQLEHRNIVPVYDYGEYEGQPYIVMRYLSGGSVDDVLAGGSLPMERILDILQQIAPALDYAHGKGVLHRDLKPSNVLLDDGGGAYLTDFGIARIASEASGVTITTQGVVGTPSYMSPEQAQGQPLDGRSDLYALAVMLFEMATGRRPFEADTPYGIAVKHVTESPPSPRSINEDISPPVEQVILTGLKKRREERYSSATEMVEALKRAMEAPYTSLSDTQPGVPRSALEALDAPTANASDFAHSPIVTPPPPQLPTPSSISMPAVRRPRRRARPNLLMSAMIGGLIGCALLAALVGLVFILSESAAREEAQAIQTATAQAAGTETASAEGGNGEPDGADAPAPDVAVATVGPMIELPGSIVFFAERNGNFDIYRLNLPERRETRLTNHAGADMFPAVSPDGTRIAFQSDQDGDFDIFVMDADGGNERRVVENTVADRLPAWSPDGEWIVFASDTRGDGTFDLLRVRSDGSDLQLLVSNGQRNSHPRWSPDGEQIVFTTGSTDDARTWEIARYTLATGEISLLTENDIKDWSPSFSPDGSTLLYLTDGSGFAAIAAMDAGGGNNRTIYDGPGYESEATYSPDGLSIAFASDESGEDELYLLTPDGGVTRLTTRGGHAPVWMPRP